MNGGLVGLVGLQGVGKSSALLAIEVGRMLLQNDEYRKTHKSGDAPNLGIDIVRFKWRRESELLPSLLNNTHEASAEFHRERLHDLMEIVKANFPHLISEDLEKNPTRLNPNWAAKMLGKQTIRMQQQASWLKMLRKKRVILIDTPDYSKTDRRLMAKDLDEIYWLWNALSQTSSTEDENKPNIVVAVQKEMFHGHFFFDKMIRVELEPLSPEQMLDAYKKRFKTTQPFTEEGLLTVARISRGIFRRFLRYITLTLTLWERSYSNSQPTISPDIVKEAVPVERLEEDMELELSELFPKHSELGRQAVRLLMHLEESGPQKQSELVEQLDMERYALSRLLGRLELYKHVTRKREGTDTIVSLRGWQPAPEVSTKSEKTAELVA